MNTAKINNELNVTYPDGFEEMNEESLTRYFGTAKDRWGVYDAERHVILTVGWKKARFLSFFTDAESVLIGAESRMKRNLVNYQRTDSFKTKIASKKKKKNARGIRFEYRVNDSVSVHTSDMRVFKNKKTFYSFQYIGRKNKDAEYHPLFDEMMESVTVG